MAKDFSAAINAIMPLVKDKDTSVPFIISRHNNEWSVNYVAEAGKAKQFLEEVRENGYSGENIKDPFAVMFTGYDFSSGSLPYVYDKVFTARLRAEYDATEPGAANKDELRAVVNFMEDYIGDFSATATEYLVRYDRPLAAIADMLPIDLKSDFSAYNENNAQKAIDFIEHRVSDLISRPKTPEIPLETALEVSPDRNLIEKIHENYAARDVGDKGLFNLMNFIDEHSGEISDYAKDYLMTIDRPLDWLGGELRADIDGNDLLLAIEEVIEDEQITDHRNAEFNGEKGNKYDASHVISSLHINGVDVELGEDRENPLPFYVESNRGNENLFGMRTDKYPEAIKAYTTQILNRVTEIALDLEDKAVMRGAEYVKLTDEDCLPDGKNADFTGKLIIVDANSLLPEYRSSTNQLMECTHGNGARPNAIGTSVFGKELYSGASVVYGRHQILGVADEAKLPQWAETKLEIRRDPSIFEYGGFHFKPERKFEKRDGDFNAQMRRMTSERYMGISAYEWGKTDYSHAKFYEAANSEADVFKCVENGKLYVPCENELFRYDEPPQKKLSADLRKECAAAIDGAGSAVYPAVKKPSVISGLDEAKVEAAKYNAENKSKPTKNKKRDGQEV
jgi:hypothetical protein